jgi:predicted cupin superfamily sugar epimerase
VLVNGCDHGPMEPSERLEAAEVIELLDLQPMATEQVLYRQFYAGPTAEPGGRPASTAIVAMLTSDPASFSDFHRLPTDEVWHFYLGDPIDLFLLGPGRQSTRVRLGPDLRAGHALYHVVPACAWMGARVAPGGRFGVFGCTMAPGYLITDFEGGERSRLLREWPAHEEEIRAMTRPDAPLRYTAP